MAFPSASKKYKITFSFKSADQVRLGQVNQGRGPSAAARKATGPSAAARQARGPSAEARQAILLPLPPHFIILFSPFTSILLFLLMARIVHVHATYSNFSSSLYMCTQRILIFHRHNQILQICPLDVSINSYFKDYTQMNSCF